MDTPTRVVATHLAVRKALKIFAAGSALACILGAASQLAIAQNSGRGGAEVPAFAPGMIDHMQKMRRFKDKNHGPQGTPQVIPRSSTDRNASGEIGTFQPGGATITANNAFFQDLGTNGRTCFTCHQPQNGWSVSAENIASRFAATGGQDPIFRLVDGATCPNANVSTLAAKRHAYKLLTDKGLIRIGLPMPAGAEFVVTSVIDPYNCTNPETGLTSPSSGIVSMYRRPLPSANLKFLSARMWDGREPNLTQNRSTPRSATPRPHIRRRPSNRRRSSRSRPAFSARRFPTTKREICTATAPRAALSRCRCRTSLWG
jgi:hypothetical protein